MIPTTMPRDPTTINPETIGIGNDNQVIGDSTATTAATSSDSINPIVEATAGERRPEAFLRMFSQLSSQANHTAGTLNAVAESHGRWEKIRNIMDSGATVTVVPPTAGKLYELQESPASRAGVEYEVANGEALPNLGQKLLPVVTQEGSLRALLAQVADVTTGLQSVRSMHATGHVVVFDGPQSFTLNKFTGEVNAIEDDGMNYIMESWIVPPEELDNQMAAAGFPGQQP
jgi:hypothetical protein